MKQLKDFINESKSKLDYSDLHDNIERIVVADYEMGDAKNIQDTSSIIGLINKHQSIIKAFDEYSNEHTSEGAFNWNALVEYINAYMGIAWSKNRDDDAYSLEEIKEAITKYDKKLTNTMIKLSKTFDED